MLILMVGGIHAYFTLLKVIQLYTLVKANRTVYISNNINKFINNFTIKYNVTQILKI